VEVYLCTFVVLFAIAAIDLSSAERSTRLICAAASATIVVLLIGLRWETGNDWQPYLDYYEASAYFSSVPSLFEPGYRLLVLASHALGLGYSSFLLLSAAIYMAAFTTTFARFRHPSVLVLMFFAIYVLGFMGTQRQTLALGFTCLAILRLYDRKIASGIALVLLAASLHYTALVTLLALVVPRTRLSSLGFGGALLAGVALYQFDVVGSGIVAAIDAVTGQGYLGARLLAYSAGGSWAQAPEQSAVAQALWFAKRMALAVAFWLLCSRPKPSLDNYLVNLYVLSVVLFLALAKAVPLLALRGPLYFAVFEVVLIYLALYRIGGSFRREALLLLGGPLAAARLYAAIALYAPSLYLPYKSVLLNTDYARFMY
jgi:hypothetical protein